MRGVQLQRAALAAGPGAMSDANVVAPNDASANNVAADGSVVYAAPSSEILQELPTHASAPQRQSLIGDSGVEDAAARPRTSDAASVPTNSALDALVVASVDDDEPAPLRKMPAPEADGKGRAMPTAPSSGASVLPGITASPSSPAHARTPSDRSTLKVPGLKHSPSRDLLSPEARAPSIPASAAFPFWVGTFNMGAKEMTVPGTTPMESFAAWIPTGYKLYVVGLQESVSEQTYKHLDQFFAQKQFDCTRLLLLPAVPQGGQGGTDGSDPSTGSGAGNNSGSGSGSSSSSSSSSSDANPPPGTVKVEGRGDGSFLKPKCTSLAVWVARPARSLVTHCASQGVSMGFTQGSKGGAAIALKILDSTFVFVSVHLSSTTLSARRTCYSTLIESLGNVLGERFFQALEQFHHVIFLGDLNYRLKNITAAEAVKFMQRGDVAGLMKYDELSAELRSKGSDGSGSSGASFENFVEAPIDFFPTYKKHENRPAMAAAAAAAGGSGGGSARGRGAILTKGGQGGEEQCNIYW